MNPVAFMAMMAGADGIPTPAESFDTAPHVSSHTSGACSAPTGTPGAHVSTSATVVLSWTLMNVNASLYGIKIYRDGVLKATLAGSVLTWTDTISGFTENPPGSGHDFTSSYVYRGDIYKLADGTVVDTKTVATWSQDYGDCTAPA